MSQSLHPAASDHSPYADLYQQHARDLFRWIRRQVFSREDAEDLLVEVFLAALESQVPLTLRTDEQRAWLQRVAQNKVIDYQRRAVKRPTVVLNEILDTPFDITQSSPEQAALHAEELELLRARLARIPELQRTVLHLRFGRGLPTKEIALLLNKSDEAVRALLVRSLTSLRRLYTPHEEDQVHGTSR
jgi:RNA polymerase sigma factor (sigma-70 family)